MSKFAVILPAAGRSSRFRDPHYKKPFAMLRGRAVWLATAELFLNRPDVKQTIVVISPEDREMFGQKFGANIAVLGIEVVDGGTQRFESVAAGLAHVRDGIDFVAVHDAVRPCVAQEWIDRVFEEAKKSDAAILAVPCTSTLKASKDGGKTVASTVVRDELWEAQTPQVFRRQLLIDAFARRKSTNPTDESQLVEEFGHRVSIVSGSRMNLKITTKDDLRLAEASLQVLPKPKLSGALHPFADDAMWR